MSEETMLYALEGEWVARWIDDAKSILQVAEAQGDLFSVGVAERMLAALGAPASISEALAKAESIVRSDEEHFGTFSAVGGRITLSINNGDGDIIETTDLAMLEVASPSLHDAFLYLADIAEGIE